MYWGATGQAIAMFLAGGFSRVSIDARAGSDTGRADSFGAAAASMVFVFTAIFGATWLVSPWVYQAEIFPLAVRARGNAWGVVGWSIGNGWLVRRLLHHIKHGLERQRTTTNTPRHYYVLSCSTPSAKKPSTSLLHATPSASRWSGPFTQRATSGH